MAVSGELGRASLDLDVEMRDFERKVAAGEHSADDLGRTLLKTAGTADLLDEALSRVKLGAGQAAESRVSAESILSGVRGISGESREAAREIDRVKLGTEQATETVAAGDVIDRKLDDIRDNAAEARRELERVRLESAAAGRGRPGVGVGPFGSGFGRIGVLGAAVGLGALTGPAAAPAAIGLLASIPTLAATGAGALGVLALAFASVGKAIGGDRKAFDDLTSSQQQFVLLVRSLDGWLDRLKQVAGQSLFPGLTKGLKAALSPGTVNAITTALVELGRALGAAGEAWGKYFGSARFQNIFGPLMKAAAGNIRLFSDTFLHLFDTLGVVAKAAIPFTHWLAVSIDKGAKFADTWLRARSATGHLAGDLNNAKDSLRLVAHLAGALVKAVFELGRALYPVAKVAVKLLTDGLNGLAGVIRRNQGDIRAFGRIALRVVAFAATAAAHGIGVLWHALESLIGHKAAIIAVITAIGVALLVAMGPESAAVLGAIVAIGFIKDHWKTIRTFFVNLGREIVHAFEYVWHLVKVGALKAALAVVEPFSHLPAFLGGWARVAKNAMQHQLDKLHAPNMHWGGKAMKDGYQTGKDWNAGWKASGPPGPRGPYDPAVDGGTPPAGPLGPMAVTGPPGVTRAQQDAAEARAARDRKRHHGHGPKPGTHAWYMKYLGYDPTTQPVFGAQPPFTTNTGSSGSSSSSASAADHHLDYVLDQAQLAVQNAAAGSKAWTRATHAEEKALRDEIRYWAKRAHDTTLTMAQRDAALKKELAYQKELRSLQQKTAGSHLQFVLDQAKVAVENAQQGTKQWDRAVRAEEKALNAEIRYWDKRAHNKKLSVEARDAALKKELEYQKELKALLAPIKQAASANEAQFIQVFKAIQNQFGSNTFPSDGGGKKTDTHLYNLVNESRESNQHLRSIRDKARFPGTKMGFDSALAATS